MVYLDIIFQIVSSMFEFPIVVSIDNSTQQGVDMESMDIMMTGACSCAISHDDKMAAMGATDGAVRVIAMETGKYLFRLQQKSSAVCLVFATDGVQLLSAGYRTIYVWSTVDGTCMYVQSVVNIYLCSLLICESCYF
ncbi:hypothetical protein DPMN_167794 [Dreissena polymorpha]|uniref:Uncharacterized protein n=1 Tax=Dreissena polymorpha TaxID=45954 RepID=A0A9D4EZG7_DREPO|nr:hypothetical protein DPMN_167794 [Dreissena polymorpha]